MQRKNKSNQAITSELLAKGVPKDIIQKKLAEIRTNEDEKKSLSELIEKLKNRSRYTDEKKLIQYLLSKGFSYQDIKEVISES